MLSLGKGSVKFMLIKGFSGQTDFGPFCFLTAPRFGLFSHEELKAAPELGAESWKLNARSWKLDVYKSLT